VKKITGQQKHHGAAMEISFPLMPLIFVLSCVGRGMTKIKALPPGPNYHLWLMAMPGSAAATCAACFRQN